ncbi:MAG: hypothetical protein ACKVG0_03625 [Alphaproteobacteria bacterium]
MLKRLLTITAGVLAVLTAPIQAFAADASFYQGKTVSYVVATDAGGGYDTYGRMVARYMQKHLPGSRFVVRNVPGAGNIIGTNLIYTARPNGLTIGMFNSGLIYNQLMGTQGIRFDLTKMSWVGKASNQIRVMVIGSNSGRQVSARQAIWTRAFSTPFFRNSIFRPFLVLTAPRASSA